MAKQEFRVLSTQMIDPEKIVLDPRFSGRRRHVDEDSVEAIAISMRDEGQKQPVQVRQIPGTDTFTRIFGTTRVLAGLRLKNGKVIGAGTDKEKTIKGIPDFKLRCEVIECSDEEAIRASMIENDQRNETTWVDKMLNHAVLRDEQEMSDAAITKLLGYAHQSTVTNLKKIHEAKFPDYMLDAGSEGTLALTAALALAKADDILQTEGGVDAVWSKVKSDGDKEAIGPQQMQEAIKAWRKEQEEKKAVNKPAENAEGGTSTEGTTTEEPAKPQTTTQLKVKEFKTLLTATAGDERCPPKTKEILTHTVMVIDGIVTPKAFLELLMKHTGETMMEPKKVEPSQEVKDMPTEDKAKVEASATPTQPQQKRKSK